MNKYSENITITVRPHSTFLKQTKSSYFLCNFFLRSHLKTQTFCDWRKEIFIKITFFRSIIECEEFQEAMSVPLGLTNTFVMLQKSDTNSISDFFLPKPQYMPPTQATTCFAIKLSHAAEMEMNCDCKNAIKVYHDLPHGKSEEDFDDEQPNRNDCPYLWYQSREVIKGFKFSR